MSHEDELDGLDDLLVDRVVQDVVAVVLVNGDVSVGGTMGGIATQAGGS